MQCFVLRIIVKEICSQEVTPSKMQVNKASILVIKVLYCYFLLHNLIYVWYIYANFSMRVLQVVLIHFQGQHVA